jgi:hypothetical protein
MLVVAGYAGAKPPRLKWQHNNCWVLSILYTLLSMPELTRYVLENEKSFASGSFEAAYASLVKAVTTNTGDKEHFWAKELKLVQETIVKAINEANTSRYIFFDLEHELTATSFGDPRGYFNYLGFKNTSTGQVPALFEKYLYGLFDIRWRPKNNDPTGPYVPAAPPEPYSLPVETEEWLFDYVLGSDDKGRLGAVPQYLVISMRDILGSLLRASLIPVHMDIAPYVDKSLGADRARYELVMMSVRKNKNHRVVYIKDPGDGEWYYADDYGSEFGVVPAPGWRPNEKGKIPWSENWYPVYFMYRNIELQEKLRDLSGSLKTLTARLGGK